MNSILRPAADPAPFPLREALPPLLFRVVVVYLVCAIPAWIVRENTFRQPGWLSPMVFQGILLIATIFLLRRSRISYQQSGLSRPVGLRWIGYLFLAIVLDLLFTLALILSRSYFTYLGDEMSPLAAVFWTGLYVPFAEELFLRGWFQTSLARFLDATKTGFVVLFSATIFALLHIGWYFRGRSGTATLIGVVATFFLGWMCARARQQTGSVFTAFAIHVVFNLTGVLSSSGLNFVLAHPKL